MRDPPRGGRKKVRTLQTLYQKNKALSRPMLRLGARTTSEGDHPNTLTAHTQTRYGIGRNPMPNPEHTLAVGRHAVPDAQRMQAHGGLFGGWAQRRVALHAVVDERRGLRAALVRHSVPSTGGVSSALLLNRCGPASP